MPGASLLCLMLPGMGMGAPEPDVIVTTRAMTATTIAEVFIEEDQLRVQLEIGGDDLPTFEDLLADEWRPDEPPSEPPADRLARFFTEGLVVKSGEGGALVGELRTVESRVRTVRDPVTGEPLPSTPEAEPVVFLELAYDLAGRPAALSLRPPLGIDGQPAASIGFVAYHRGLAVNDFRYLAAEEVLDLDWEDPWYSRFRNRKLWRQFHAPLAAFLYVDAVEVRKEVIVRPRDLRTWMDLDLGGEEVLRADRQEVVAQQVATFLAGRGPVWIDGEQRPPVLDRVHFIERSLRQTNVVEPGRDLPLVAATLGVIFVYPVTAQPAEVRMEWDLFSDRIQTVPSTATDTAGSMAKALTPGDAALQWQNRGQLQPRRDLIDVEALVTEDPGLPVTGLLAGLAALGLGIRAVRRRSRQLLPVLATAVLTVVVWPYGRVPAPAWMGLTHALDPQQSASVLQALLQNVYRAFDARGEEAIYDTLARSTAGASLNDVYLQTRRSLELQNQGGARVQVKNVALVESRAEPLAEALGFEADCTWNVLGSVGHWGHVHQRANQYQAKVRVQKTEAGWRIVGLELQGETRL